MLGCLSFGVIMSSHKQKRDTPVDLSKMQLVKQRLRALKEELSGIKERPDEMEQIMTHVNASKDILDTTKKLVRDKYFDLSFSAEITACGNSDFGCIEEQPIKLGN